MPIGSAIAAALIASTLGGVIKGATDKMNQNSAFNQQKKLKTIDQTKPGDFNAFGNDLTPAEARFNLTGQQQPVIFPNYMKNKMNMGQITG